MNFLDAREFIRVYISSATEEQVCIALNLDRRSVQNRAAAMRRNGVKLPFKKSKKGPRKNADYISKKQWKWLADFAERIKAGEEAKLKSK